MRQRTRAVHPVTQWTGSDCPRQGRRGTLGPEVSFKPRLGTSFLLARPSAQGPDSAAAGPRPPATDPAGWRGGGGSREHLLSAVATDCAVGSGEWAEPPHYPWTLRRRGRKMAIFWPFFGPRGSFMGRAGARGRRFAKSASPRAEVRGPLKAYICSRGQFGPRSRSDQQRGSRGLPEGCVHAPRSPRAGEPLMPWSRAPPGGTLASRRVTPGQ